MLIRGFLRFAKRTLKSAVFERADDVVAWEGQERLRADGLGWDSLLACSRPSFVSSNVYMAWDPTHVLRIKYLGRPCLEPYLL